jgi:hypothetical protein
LFSFFQFKRKNQRKENSRFGVVVGDTEEKDGECKENILSAGGKSEEASDLKKYLKML